MLNLSKREINVLIAGITFVVLFFGYQFGIVSIIEKRDNLNRILDEKQSAIENMVLLQQKVAAVSNSFDAKTQALATRKKDFSLFTFLDSQAQLSGVKENVAYMKPFTKELEGSPYTIATVKIKLKEVYLKELVKFLYLIESSKNGVGITSFSLSKTGKNKMLDAVIETQTLTQKDKA